MRGNGEEQTFSMIQEYVFTVEGDAIKGSIEVHPPEGISSKGPSRTFTGKRASEER